MGSEMCIRDSLQKLRRIHPNASMAANSSAGRRICAEKLFLPFADSGGRQQPNRSGVHPFCPRAAVRAKNRRYRHRCFNPCCRRLGRAAALGAGRGHRQLSDHHLLRRVQLFRISSFYEIDFLFLKPSITTQKERRRLCNTDAASLFILKFSVIAPSRRTLWQGVRVSFRPGRCGNPQTHNRCTSAAPSPTLPRCPTKRTPAYAAYGR